MTDRARAVRVVAAVIENSSGEILIARRPDHLHQGGLWEFPGGKLEAREQPYAALARELAEELGICVSGAQPLLKTTHDYPDKSVELDVWRVTAFAGVAHGREGQQIAWVKRDKLACYRFPAANIPILEQVVS